VTRKADGSPVENLLRAEARAQSSLSVNGSSDRSLIDRDLRLFFNSPSVGNHGWLRTIERVMGQTNPMEKSGGRSGQRRPQGGLWVRPRSGEERGNATQSNNEKRTAKRRKNVLTPVFNPSMS